MADPMTAAEHRAEAATALAQIMAGEPHEDMLVLWWSDQLSEAEILENLGNDRI